jgi:GTP-dependent dephospho-CoA kinase
VSSEQTAWVVPDSQRALFSARYGPVYSGAEVDRRMSHLTQFATCGDRVTAQAIEIGHLPFLGVVDYKTQRNDPIDPAVFRPLAARRIVRVRNPAGMLTEGLRRAVREMIQAGGGLIVVEGEEDLAALALVESMPSGATVIYGIPGAGASFVAVDAAAQANVRELIERMERRRVDLGS